MRNKEIKTTGLAACPDCLQRIAIGDSEAFAWVYNNYREKVYGYAVMMAADTHQREDIVQEVFFKIWRRKEQLTAVTDFNSWLFIVTKNYITDCHKKQRREECIVTAYREQQGNDFSPAPVDNERDLLMEAAVQQLSPQQKIVFVLQKQYNWKRAAVAKTLNLSPQTIRNHMSDAIKKVTRHCQKNYRPG